MLRPGAGVGNWSAAPGQHVSTARIFKGVPAGQTLLLDTGLTPGIVYSYQIQARTGKLYSPMSGPKTLIAAAAPVRPVVHSNSVPPPAPSPVTVTLAVSTSGHGLQANLSFLNVSSKPVYLDKISGCLDGKIGDNVFYVATDGQQIPYIGRKTPRRSPPGPRQFTELLAGENTGTAVDLGRSYRLLPGTHTYTVTYAAAHTYPGRFQSLLLHSAPVTCTLSR